MGDWREVVGGGGGRTERLGDKTYGDFQKQGGGGGWREAGRGGGLQREYVGTFRNRGGVGRGAGERRGERDTWR